MATEKDFELMDDYLSNRLEGQDKVGLEKKLASDSSLKGELEFQKALIDGIQKARVADLKSMLNQAVIPSPTSSSLFAKVAITIAVVAAVGTGLYFWLDDEAPVIESVPQTKLEESIRNEPLQEESVILEDDNKVENEEAVISEKRELQEQASSNKATDTKEVERKSEVVKAPVTQPSLEPYDPTKELEQISEKPEVVQEGNTPSITGSAIAVEIDNTNRKFEFHYQFKDGKLFLLGSFEKDLYEILEFFNDNKRTIFLYYNAGYYLLDEDQTNPTPLKAINDQSLIQKLKGYRGK
jgi:hypothetical protein